MAGSHLEQCPFCGHRECFSIYEDNRKFKCHSCSKQGDVFNFIEEYCGLSKSEAFAKTASMAGIELGHREYEREDKAESLKEQMYRLTADYYHAIMMAPECPGQKWFCKKRGHSIETLKKMNAGWSDDGLLSYLKGKGFSEADVIRYGLAKKESDKPTKDYFWKDLVIFPVMDHAGKVLSFTCKDPQKKYPGLMLQSVKKTWFLNYQVAGKWPETFVVEGENDEASLIDVGFTNVLGTAGGLAAEQVKLLRNFYSGKTLYLWFDKDLQKDYKKYSGGAHHIEFLSTRLRDSDVNVRIIAHPGSAKDPDEFIQSLLKEGKTVNEIRIIVKQLKDDAIDPLTWELKMLSDLPDAKTRLEVFKARKLAHALNAIEIMAEQEVYTELAAKSIGISLTN